jgi:formamidopyrimidine-DNA glycosylase
MPELPEVETIANALHQKYSGHTVQDICFHRDSLREPIATKHIKAAITHQVIGNITRRSKYILFAVGDFYLISHLGMTGRYIESQSSNPTVKHTHFVLALDKKGQNNFLHYVDPRRFGRLAAVAQKDLAAHPWFSGLGPEPLGSFSLSNHLQNKALNRTVPIKNFIMNPAIVVGVGNIYASESLWCAQISPNRITRDLSKVELQKLSRCIRRVLQKAITAGGTSFSDYRQIDGNTGYFQQELNVYGKSGSPCNRCFEPISEGRHAGRSSYWCPSCQL